MNSLSLISRVTCCRIAAARAYAITTESYGKGETNLAASGTTGIEHAYAHNKLGESKHKQNPDDYKCAEYLNSSTMSYYDVEAS